MRVSFNNDTFVCACTYEERFLPSQAGFTFNPLVKAWETKSFKVAVGLLEYFDRSAKEKFLEVSFIPEKKSWAGPLVVPNHQRLDDYQIEAVNFAAHRNNCYLALEQGLGKTPISIVLINSLYKNYFGVAKILVIVPPFLITNWLREFEAWGVGAFKIDVVNYSAKRLEPNADVYLISDTMIGHRGIKYQVEELKLSFDLMIVDEAHRFNNIESKRAQALYDFYAVKAARKVWLSGTPMRNRPIELYPALSRLALNLIAYRNYWEYAHRYCDARYVQVSKYKKVFDVSGSSNEDELSKNISPFMKVEKLEDHVKLKGKTERLRILDGKTTRKIIGLEKAILKKHKLNDIIAGQSLGDIATYRKELTAQKLPVAHEYLTDVLNSSEDTVIVFAWHTDLVLALAHRLKNYKPLVIYGAVKNKDRDVIVDKIQKGESRLLIANIATMVGINLTRATRAVFAESSWVPSDNAQAVSRLYRRGQTKKVVVDHLVIANTLDEYVMKTALDKSKTINQIVKG